MTEFPSPRERIAASALLILSAKTDSLFCFDEDDAEFVKEKKCKCNSAKESLVLSDSKSCCSSLSSEESFSDQINRHRLRIVTPVSRLREMKFEVVRKVRSKYYRTSDIREFTSAKPATVMSPGSVSENTEASCLSSSSSAISSARSRNATRGRQESSKRKHVSPVHMRRRAEAILRLLSSGCASEMRIRQVLGDSPDTSKALRMLLKLEEIKRSGAGGRADPFIYTVKF